MIIDVANRPCPTDSPPFGTAESTLQHCLLLAGSSSQPSQAVGSTGDHIETSNSSIQWEGKQEETGGEKVASRNNKGGLMRLDV